MKKWFVIPADTGAELALTTSGNGYVEIELEQEAEPGRWMTAYAALTPHQARYLSRMLDVVADIAREEDE